VNRPNKVDVGGHLDRLPAGAGRVSHPRHGKTLGRRVRPRRTRGRRRGSWPVWRPRLDAMRLIATAPASLLARIRPRRPATSDCCMAALSRSNAAALRDFSRRTLLGESTSIRLAVTVTRTSSPASQRCAESGARASASPCAPRRRRAAALLSDDPVPYGWEAPADSREGAGVSQR